MSYIDQSELSFSLTTVQIIVDLLYHILTNQNCLTYIEQKTILLSKQRFTLSVKCL